LQLLEDAAKLTEQARNCAGEDKDRWLNASMNLLYYWTALLPQMEKTRHEDLIARASSVLDEVRPLRDDANWTIAKLDTLLRAEWQFGEKDEAPKLAEIILRRLGDEIPGAPGTVGQSLSPDDRDMYLFALEVKKGTASA